jgi:hypothetical protein
MGRADHEAGLAKWAADRVASGSLPQWVAAEAVNYLKTRRV